MSTGIGKGMVRSVAGDLQCDPDVGVALVHEHLSCDLSRTSGPTYLLNDLALMTEELRYAAGVGVRLVVDVGNSGHGRDVSLLEGIARDTGVVVVASTGHYREGFFPPIVESATVEQLAELMVNDIEVGFPGGNVRAGAIAEIGFSSEVPTANEEKVMTAAGLAQARTGAPLLTHTPEGKGWRRQLELLVAGGADLNKVVIGHMDCIDDGSAHLGVLESGAWLGFDRVNSTRYQTDDIRCERLVDLVRLGYGNRVILSMDIATTTRFRADGAPGYGGVVTDFVPRLERAGVTDTDIHQLLANSWQYLLS